MLSRPNGNKNGDCDIATETTGLWDTKDIDVLKILHVKFSSKNDICAFHLPETATTENITKQI